MAWSAPIIVHQQQDLNRVIGYRMYRRISNDGLNDRPWFAVATVGPKARSVSVDRCEFPEDYHWYSKAECFAVSAIGDCSVESELVEVLLPGK